MCTTVVTEENEEENEIPSPVRHAVLRSTEEVRRDEGNTSVKNASGQFIQGILVNEVKENITGVLENDRKSETMNAERGEFSNSIQHDTSKHSEETSSVKKKGEKEEKVVIVDAIHESEIEVNVTTECDMEVDVDAIVEGAVSVHMEGRPEDLMTLVQRDVNIIAPQGMSNNLFCQPPMLGLT